MRAVGAGCGDAFDRRDAREVLARLRIGLKRVRDERGSEKKGASGVRCIVGGH